MSDQKVYGDWKYAEEDAHDLFRAGRDVRIEATVGVNEDDYISPRVVVTDLGPTAEKRRHGTYVGEDEM